MLRGRALPRYQGVRYKGYLLSLGILAPMSAFITNVSWPREATSVGGVVWRCMDMMFLFKAKRTAKYALKHLCTSLYILMLLYFAVLEGPWKPRTFFKGQKDYIFLSKH